MSKPSQESLRDLLFSSPLDTGDGDLDGLSPKQALIETGRVPSPLNPDSHARETIEDHENGRELDPEIEVDLEEIRHLLSLEEEDDFVGPASVAAAGVSELDRPTPRDFQVDDSSEDQKASDDILESFLEELEESRKKTQASATQTLARKREREALISKSVLHQQSIFDELVRIRVLIQASLKNVNRLCSDRKLKQQHERIRANIRMELDEEKEEEEVSTPVPETPQEDVPPPSATAFSEMRESVRSVLETSLRVRDELFKLDNERQGHIRVGNSATNEREPNDESFDVLFTDVAGSGVKEDQQHSLNEIWDRISRGYASRRSRWISFLNHWDRASMIRSAAIRSDAQTTTGSSAASGRGPGSLQFKSINQTYENRVENEMRQNAEMLRSKSRWKHPGTEELVEGTYFDPDFYRGLLKTFLRDTGNAGVQLLGSEGGDILASLAEERVRREREKKKKKKKRENTAGGRKLSFDVVPKLVGFMPAVPFEYPKSADILFRNLFGGKFRHLQEIRKEEGESEE